MANLIFPPIGKYKLPKKNVLVISCMDLRLTDNMVDFLHADNLTNRYDHFILAGASLLCSKQYKDLFNKGSYKKYEHWKKCLDNHLELAVTLHQIKDVYIIEHQDCGAYTNLLDKEKVDLSSFALERGWHEKFARSLADEIHSKQRTDKYEALDGKSGIYQLNVHCFFIDLRGNVELLYTTTK